MDLSTGMNIAYSGMAAQAARMKVIAQNIANADSTSPAPGQDPYRRQEISFKTVFDKSMGASVLKVTGTSGDPTPFRSKLDPSNPAADSNGYVKLSNVNTLVENADLKEAQRSYEASLAAMDLVKSVAMQTIGAIKS